MTPTRRREAPAKDNAEEEVADGTAGAGRLFGARAAEEAKWLLVRTVLTMQQTTLSQDRATKENEGKESELAYSSFSAEEEEYASVTLFLLLLTSSTSLNNYHRHK